MRESEIAEMEGEIEALKEKLGRHTRGMCKGTG
jgi:hypothetical protein